MSNFNGFVDVVGICGVNSGDDLFRSNLSISRGARSRSFGTDATYAGSIVLIELPLDDGTNSLPMNNPVGCVYRRPLGA